MLKLGPHILTLTSPAATWCQCAPIVKAVDYPAALTLARPDAITIFRAYVDNERQNTITPREFLDLTLQRLGGFRPTYIEGLNEHRQKISAGLLDYIEWTRQFTELAHAAGYKVAGFGFSTGNPDAEDWLALRDAGFAGVDALSIHEYWGNVHFTGWNALRCTKVHEWLNGQHPFLIVTECGRDAIPGEGTEGQRGWKTQGVDSIAYADELLAYARELEKRSYVLGATVFTSGPTPDWDDFDADYITYYLIEALANDVPAGGQSMPVIDEDGTSDELEQLRNQNAELTAALIAHLKGNDYSGADSTAGHLIALTGKSLDELGISPKA